MHDHLGEQRVEGGAGLVAGTAERIDAHAGPGRQIEQPKRAAGRLGGAVLVHHFHIDAKLHRIATRSRDISLRQTERTERGAVGDRKLRLHQIDAEHLLGHGVLDLKPRIGFDEGKGRPVALDVAIDQEFEGAEIVIVGGGGEFLGGLDNACAQTIVQRRARRHLDQLLVPPLDGAFALPQMADRAMVVTDDLHLDMPGVADQALDIDAVAAEGGLRLGLAARIGFFELVGVIDDAHAAPAAAGNGLDHDRGTGAERGEERLGLVERGRSAGALDDGHAGVLGQRFCPGLVAEQIQRLRRRPDKSDPLCRTAPRQQGVLAEKTVAGMQRVAAGGLGRGNDGFDIEIGPRAPPRDFVGRIGRADMQRQGIIGGVDRNRRKAGLPGSARDTNGDLAAIGDQELAERA